MADEPGSKFRIVVLLGLTLALAVAIVLMGRIALNLSPVARQVDTPTPTLTPAPTRRPPTSTPLAPTPTRPQPTPTQFPNLADAPTATPTATPVPPVLISQHDTLTSSISLPAFTPTPTGRIVCRVNVAPLDLREGPGDEYNLINVLPDGAPLSAIKRAAHSVWLLVETEQRQVGWVYGPCVACQNDPTTLPTVVGLASAPTLPTTTPAPAPPASPEQPQPEPTEPPSATDPSLPPLSQDYWRGEYFNNASLEGEPVLVRLDPVNLEFNWILDSPAPNVPADNFSVRWTRLVDFLDGGDYRFYAEADDGVKIQVDGQLVLNNWNLFAPITYQGDLHDVSPGLHPVTVEYFESGGHARIKVWADRRHLEDDKWVGQYYANPDWQEPAVLTRQDETIDFDWGDSSPAPGLGHSDFSIRWRRTIHFTDGGNYRFFAEVAKRDRVRIFLDDWLLVDKSKDGGGTVEGYFSELGPGFHTVTVEYLDESGGARIKFDWERL